MTATGNFIRSQSKIYDDLSSNLSEQFNGRTCFRIPVIFTKWIV